MVRRTLVFALTLVGLSACSPEGAGMFSFRSETAMPDAAEGAALFAQHCAACHGTTAQGDGPLASTLRPAPADLTQIAARNDGVFPRAEVLSAMDGYTKADVVPTAMPEFGALLEGDTVPVTLNDESLSPVPRPLAALLVYVESLQQ